MYDGTTRLKKSRKLFRKLFCVCCNAFSHICQKEKTGEQNCWCEPGFESANRVDLVAHLVVHRTTIKVHFRAEISINGQL